MKRQKSSTGSVFVENDIRAHCNPTRQAVIRKAADHLIQKHLPISETWCCSACNYEDEKRLNSPQFADPSRCEFCNP